ncbi:hypothetical protein [Spirosoma sp. KNUC1025]|uniref:hypothetical protein n=1 Tax=Spirosoma sp. KNUC1025 TaxID=2894082 RepID=UPI003865A5EF|nr:hypothetical protein LN737_23845 [Spirosoma sp. KNUC1025]
MVPVVWSSSVIVSRFTTKTSLATLFSAGEAGGALRVDGSALFEKSFGVIKKGQSLKRQHRPAAILFDY